VFFLAFFGLPGAGFPKGAEPPKPEYYLISYVRQVPIARLPGNPLLKKATQPVIEQSRPSEVGPPAGMGNVLNKMAWGWRVIESNRPIITTDFPKFANAIPREAKGADELTGWRQPVLVPVHLHATNGLKIRVLNVSYGIHFSYGGMFNGRGKYLANVTVVPQGIWAAPGFQISVSARVLAVLNYGSKKHPIAAIQLLVTEKVSSMVSDKVTTRSFIIKGDGGFDEIFPTVRKAYYSNR
jgi:hypothetical protein